MFGTELRSDGKAVEFLLLSIQQGARPQIEFFRRRGKQDQNKGKPKNETGIKVKVWSHISKYREVIVTIEKHKDRDGTLSLHTTIDGQVFRPTANDSFKSMLKECRAQIDHWIDEQKVFVTWLK